MADDVGADLVTRPGWLPREQYPFVVRRRDVAGGAVTYIDEGSGPTLLFVHAGLWSFVFRDVVTRLRADFRCVALDFPGFGLAPPSDDDLSIADLADVLTTFVTGLDLRDVTVVAHDLGGPVALTTPAVPDRVLGLVLANTFAWTPDQRGLRAMLRLVCGTAMERVGAATNVVALLTSTRFGVGRHLDRVGRAAFRGPFRACAVRRRFHRLMASTLRRPAFTDGVARAVATVLADTPVLTVFGARNDPFGFQARLAERFADHEGVVVAAATTSR
jgi:haloalkane dehalogenase